MGIAGRYCAVRLSIILAIITVCGGVADAQVRETLGRAVEEYRAGNHDAAVKSFESAFKQDPSNDVIWSFGQQVEIATLFRMARSTDQRLAGIATAILSRMREVHLEKRGDSVAIQEVVADVFSNPDEKFAERLEASQRYGRNLVPFLVRYLADGDLDKQTVAFKWIADIGRQVVPVLLAARKHPDLRVRVGVARLLSASSLRTRDSLGALRAMTQDASDEVRQAASESYRVVVTRLRARESSAQEHYLRTAYRYYRYPHRNEFDQSNYKPMIYSLAGKDIVATEVARFQFSEMMAKQTLEAALEIDSNYDNALLLSACNDSAIVVEFDENIAYYSEQDSDTQMKEVLESQRAYVDNVVRLRIRATPTSILHRALGQALEDGRPEVAQKIIDVLREDRRQGRDVPNQLIRALRDDNSRLVRTKAAIALAEWNSADLDAGGDVISTLSEAVVTSGIRVVQKIMGDRQRANRMDALLRNLNMESYSPYETISEGYTAVTNSPPDAVFVDTSVRMKQQRRGGTMPINHFVTTLRRDYRTQNVPVIVIVADEEESEARDVYESEERKVWVVPEEIDSQGLSRLFERLFVDKRDAKAQATALAADAARALEFVAGVSQTELPVGASREALGRVLRNRPDAVRLPCIRALGHLGGSDAAGRLAEVYDDDRNSLEIRTAALRAIGDALQSIGSASDRVLHSIQDGMRQSGDLRRAAWYAFSGVHNNGAARLVAWSASAPGTDAAAPEASSGDDLDEGDGVDEEEMDGDDAEEEEEFDEEEFEEEFEEDDDEEDFEDSLDEEEDDDA